MLAPPSVLASIPLLSAAAAAQPFIVSNPQRVVGATGACCAPGALSTFATGPWTQGVSAQCAAGGASAHQNTQLTSEFVGGAGDAAALAAASCTAQATSSMLIPFDLAAQSHVRIIARLESTGSLLARLDLKVLPLLSVVRSWSSPAAVDENLILAPGSYRLSVSAGGGVTTPGVPGSASFDIALEPACDANCDGSSMPPVLNVNDFMCFSARFAAADPWANCDGSTVPPRLNVNDFVCFLNRFAAGCP